MDTDSLSGDSPTPRSPDESRQRLYEVMADEDLSLSAKRGAVLEVGREYLGVELAYLSDIDRAADTMEVVACDTDIEWVEPGLEVDLSDTYCRRTVEDDSSLAVSDAAGEGMEDHPAHREYGMSCYLGTPVYAEGELFGTLCFVDRDRRPVDFSESERAFVELAARMVGHEYELLAREREVASRERDLERSERKYESLVTAAPDAIFLVDAETGEIVEVNESAAALTGRSTEDLVGSDATSIHPPEAADRYRAELCRSIEGNGSPRRRSEDGRQLYIRRADGTDVPVEMGTEVVELDGRSHVQSIVRDISDRRERERELRLKNRAIENAPVGISIADAGQADDNEIVYVNEHFEAITGYEAEEILGRDCRFLQGPGTDADRTDRIGEALRRREPVTAELLNYRADGSRFWNHLSIAPVTDERGEPTHFVGFQRDVTDRKRRDQLISVLNRVLRHNLRNEMNVVLMEAERLRARLDGDGAAIADRIRDAARALTALGERARDIQRVTRSTAGPAPGDVAALVGNVADRLREEHPEASVTVSAPPERTALVSDALPEAVAELGTNAIRHGGETVEFEVRAVEYGTVIRVADDGPGLPESERRILDGAEETQLTHGSGLGLWFVNWVVTELGGHVEPTVADGTAVELHLRDPPSVGDS
jgi:PAS domain S-box-containing protein